MHNKGMSVAVKRLQVELTFFLKSIFNKAPLQSSELPG